MSEEEFRKIAKEYAEMYFTKGINSTKIFYYVDELEKKVEQLEKELQTTANNCKQLENIRKEAIEYVYKHIQEYDVDGTFTNLDEFDFIASPQALLNILNKGDNNGK